MSTKLSAPKYPPIDWLMAAILERKRITKMEWADLATAARITPENLRRLASTKPPLEWPTDVRQAVCRKLGINAKLVIEEEHNVSL